MDTDLLRHFCAVVETGTIAKASGLLRMSPGALSRSLRRLADEVGVALFVPSGRVLELTDAGRRFYVDAKRFLEDVSATLTRLRGEANRPKVVRIGSFEVFTAALLVSALEELRDESFLMQELTPGFIEDAILARSVDFGVTYVPMPRPGLDVVELGRFRMVAVARKNAFARVSFEEIPFAVPITVLGKNVAQIESLDSWPPGVPRNVKYYFELLETSLEACRRGFCALHAPEFIAALANEARSPEAHLVPLALPRDYEPVTLSAYLVKRTGHPEDRVVRRLAASIRRGVARRLKRA